MLRRQGSLAAALVALIAVGSGVAVSRSGSGQAAGSPTISPAQALLPAPRPAVPDVDLAALHGEGSLAFVSRGALWLLDSSTYSVHKLQPAKDHPSQPTFSADGKWLAFSANPPHARYGEWLVRSDGRGLRRVVGRDLGVDGWSPQGHRLAVERYLGHGVSAVGVLSPRGGRRDVVRIAGLTGVAWSPDGRALAVAATGWVRHPQRAGGAVNPLGRTTLTTYPISGGAPTTWFSTNARNGRLAGMNQLRLSPAGWWRGQGIAFWVTGDGAVLGVDQRPLEELRQPGATPRLLGSTLSNSAQPSVVAARTGEVAMVDETRRDGFGRQIWFRKRISVCLLTAACRRVPAPPHTVTLDPAWSPDGETLAYVVAPSRASVGFPQGVVRRWYAAHRLALYDLRTRTVRPVPGSDGASVPVWSGDGKFLLFAARNGIWSLRVGTARATRVAAPLFAPGAWPVYYGQVDWVGKLAWSAAG